MVRVVRRSISLLRTARLMTLVVFVVVLLSSWFVFFLCCRYFLCVAHSHPHIPNPCYHSKTPLHSSILKHQKLKKKIQHRHRKCNRQQSNIRIGNQQPSHIVSI